MDLPPSERVHLTVYGGRHHVVVQFNFHSMQCSIDDGAGDVLKKLPRDYLAFFGVTSVGPMPW